MNKLQVELETTNLTIIIDKNDIVHIRDHDRQESYSMPIEVFRMILKIGPVVLGLNDKKALPPTVSRLSRQNNEEGLS